MSTGNLSAQQDCTLASIPRPVDQIGLETEALSLLTAHNGVQLAIKLKEGAIYSTILRLGRQQANYEIKWIQDFLGNPQIVSILPLSEI